MFRLFGGGRVVGLFALLALLTANCSESRAVTIDGIVGAGEYAQGFVTTLTVQGSSTVMHGELWLSQSGSNVSMAFVQPVDLVDNSYGANAIGWGTNAPSGKNHKFSDLLKSDKLQLSVVDSGGAVLGSLELDYLAQVGSSFQAQVVTGLDFNGKVTAFKTSLDYDLNVVAGGNATVPAAAGGTLDLTVDSPEVNQTTGYPATITTPGLAAWEFATVYEFELANPGFTVADLINGNATLAGIGGAGMAGSHGGEHESSGSSSGSSSSGSSSSGSSSSGSSGSSSSGSSGSSSSGGLGLPLFHDSPNKIGKNKVTDPVGFGSPLTGGSPSVVPEPSSFILLLIGSMGLLAYRIRRRQRRPASISAA